MPRIFLTLDETLPVAPRPVLRLPSGQLLPLSREEFESLAAEFVWAFSVLDSLPTMRPEHPFAAITSVPVRTSEQPFEHERSA